MSKFDWLLHQVQSIKPGQWLTIARSFIDDCPKPFLEDEFSIPDRILENIIGSSYEFYYRIEPITRDITFCRLEKPLTDGRRSYVSPDQREWFDFDGTFYTPKRK